MDFVRNYKIRVNGTAFKYYFLFYKIYAHSHYTLTHTLKWNRNQEDTEI